MALVKMEEAQEREAIVKKHEGEENEARKKKGGGGGGEDGTLHVVAVQKFIFGGHSKSW